MIWKKENVPGVCSWIGMNRHEPGFTVVGVDVGSSKKGFHAVALQDGHYRENRSCAKRLQAGQ